MILSDDPLQMLDDEIEVADKCAADLGNTAESAQADGLCDVMPTGVSGSKPWWMRPADEETASAPTRHPMPNYAAEFVQAHNPVSYLAGASAARAS